MSDGNGTSRILIVEDHPLLRQGLAAILDEQPEFTVVAEAGSLVEARPMVRHIDVALIDLGLPDGDGVDLIAELREANPDAMALVLTASIDRGQLARAVEAGAAGVLNKAVGLCEIIVALRRLRAGHMLLSSAEIIELAGVAARQKERENYVRSALGKLTPRETEVLKALAAGMDDKRISQHLRITVETERKHMNSIFEKLGVHSRLQALLFAVRNGLVDLDGGTNRPDMVPRDTGPAPANDSFAGATD